MEVALFSGRLRNLLLLSECENSEDENQQKIISETGCSAEPVFSISPTVAVSTNIARFR